MSSIKKRYLFCCETGYQLFNAINLHMTVAKDVPADVILTEQTDFSSIVPTLKEAGIFEQVICPDSQTYSSQFWMADLEKQVYWYQNPNIFMPQFPSEYEYSDIFVPIDHIYWQILYYHQLKRGIKANLFFFEEGLRAYTMDFLKTEESRQFVLNYYKDDSFARSVKAFYLYEPELYSNASFNGELKLIPKIQSRESEVAKTIQKVFPTSALPEEKYIFFEESYIGDKRLSNDFELFEKIAEKVGRDNIIVKRHPRNTIDRFSDAGYKVMDNWKTPWEAMLLENSAKGYVFITISSTASLTPMLLFDEEVKSIHLLKLFKGESPLLSDPGFMECYFKALSLCNKKVMNVYQPYTLQEVFEILNYLNITKLKGL